MNQSPSNPLFDSVAAEQTPRTQLEEMLYKALYSASAKLHSLYADPKLNLQIPMRVIDEHNREMTEIAEALRKASWRPCFGAFIPKKAVDGAA